MSLFHDSALVGASGQGGGYEIERSLRFNSSDSAYLSRAPASAGNRKTWTWAGWVKRGTLGVQGGIFSAGTGGTNDSSIVFNASTEIIDWFNRSSSSINARLQTTNVFRDCSAWYHFVFVWNTTVATASDRMQIWVNGSRITSFGLATYPSQNTDSFINSNVINYLGTQTLNTNFNGYLADIHFIDGQALDPSSFTEVSATTGQLIPKQYTGSFGTNGFWLKFSDNSAATATTLGKDYSGNSNNWTPNNLSVTAGAGNDSLVDTPTSYGTDTGAGGEVRGNYCTWNPLDKDADVTLTNGNLDMTQSAAGGVKGTIHVSSGKWYWEIAIATTVNQVYGIATSAAVPSTYVGGYAGSAGVASAGTLYSSGNFTKVNGATPISGVSPGDTIGFALDLDSSPKTLKFYRNGTLQTGNHFVITETGPLTPVVGTNVADNAAPGSANFGQRPWAFTPPAGHKALCTTNLPAPTITKPSTVMDVALWTGNGSARSITGLGFNPDLVWIKGRSGATDHALYDSVRGVTIDLVSNSTAAETTQTQGLTAFNSDGFSLGTLAKVNTNAATYAGWTWDAGSSTVTNTSGTISSQVRANTSAGFSIVTWTGTGAHATIGHGLGVAPAFIITKKRNSSSNWATNAPGRSNPWEGALLLNTTDAFTVSSAVWQSTAPTSSVFYVGTADAVNVSSATYVAYCFAPVAGYSNFGSYVGNGSSDGPFVYTGFRPRWVMIKATGGSTGNENWMIKDALRPAYNPTDGNLYANQSFAEDSTSTVFIDLVSNGFKIRGTYAGLNTSAVTYIYAAFAENPFQYARAR